MKKKEIREIYQRKRLELHDHEQHKMDDLILIQFQKISLPDLNLVHSYIPSVQLKEPDTWLILRFLQFQFPRLRVAAPRITDRHTCELKHYLLTGEDDMTVNSFGVEEPAGGEEISPEEIDLALIPLLGFDVKGYRVGFGKGYYDRFLSHCRPDMMKIGLSYFRPVDVIEDTDNYDVRLDYCCTPDGIYSW